MVSLESVRIAFLIAALSNLDIKAADIGNAHPNAPPRRFTSSADPSLAQRTKADMQL